MRDILFRGKHVIGGDWVEGNLFIPDKDDTPTQILIGTNFIRIPYDVIPETVGQYTGLTDKNGKKIFEGDIIQYPNSDGYYIEDFCFMSIVKFGEYKQDGSCGEYEARDCIGFYAEVTNFICPDWCGGKSKRCKNGFDCRFEYIKQHNIFEIAKECVVIGDIYDNPGLLKGDKDND